MLSPVVTTSLAVAIHVGIVVKTAVASPIDDDVTANAQVKRCAASAKVRLEQEMAKLKTCTAVSLRCSVDLFKKAVAVSKIQCYEENSVAEFQDIGSNMAAKVACPGDGKDLSLTNEFVSRLCNVDPFYHPEDYFQFAVSIRHLPKQQFLAGFEAVKNSDESVPKKPQKVAATMESWALQLQAEPYNCKFMKIQCAEEPVGEARSVILANDCKVIKNDKRLKNPVVIFVRATRDGNSNASFNIIPVAHDYKKSNRSERLSKIIDMMDSLNCDNDIKNKPNMSFQDYAKHLQEATAKL